MADFPQGVALVVGGSGGIGSAIARGFAEAGVPLAITYRHHEDAAVAVAEKIRAEGGLCSVHPIELGNLDSVKACLDELGEEHGTVHTVAHAAGTHIDQPYISQLTPEQWRNTMDWDVNGFFHVAHAALPHLRKSQGSIVFISSAGLKRFPPGDVLSVAPKGAIEALMRGHRARRGAKRRPGKHRLGGSRRRRNVSQARRTRRAQPGMDRRGYPQHAASAFRHVRGGCRRCGVPCFVEGPLHHRADHFCRRWLYVVAPRGAD